MHSLTRLLLLLLLPVQQQKHVQDFIVRILFHYEIVNKIHLCEKASKAFKLVEIGDNIKVDDIIARFKLFECALE